MKKIFIISMIALAALGTANASEVDLNQQECATQCEFLTYNFAQDFLGNCSLLEKCVELEWDQESQTCHFVTEEIVSYPVHCRDIPPL